MSAIDTIISILTAVAPLELSEPGDENTCAIFTCPTCGGEGDLDSAQVAEFLGSPTSFPIGMVGIQMYGIGEGHNDLAKALSDLPAELTAMKAALKSANDLAAALIERIDRESAQARDAGLTFTNIREAVGDLANEEISFSRLVEIMRAALIAVAAKP